MKIQEDPAPPGDSAAAYETALQQSARDAYVLRLFVAGMTPNSRLAIENIRKFCSEHLEGRYQLEIIDIYQQLACAEEWQIIVAPTLVKELPPPLRKFIGNMSQTERLLLGLNVRTKRL
jgi:circadian clock protein KaiB